MESVHAEVKSNIIIIAHSWKLGSVNTKKNKRWSTIINLNKKFHAYGVHLDKFESAKANLIV